MGEPEQSLVERRDEMIEKIMALIGRFESFMVLDEWYDAMVCSYRLRSSFYCYRKLVARIKGGES